MSTPEWVWELLDAIHRFEEEHPKVEACICADYERIVPKSVRDAAAVMRDRGVIPRKEAAAIWRDGWDAHRNERDRQATDPAYPITDRNPFKSQEQS